MPTYEYHCSSCNATYDLRQGFDAENSHTCEECGKGEAKRVLHAPKVHFKGSGWYITDSKGTSSSLSDNKPADTAAPAADAAPSTTTTSDTAPSS